MESQMHRPTHPYEENPQSAVIEGEGEEVGHDHDHHGEKKSVLKKVKDKAKKIKDTIKHGHGHKHDASEEEDDTEDVEMVDDPEVHGAPMYDSSLISGTKLPRQVDANLEKQAVDRYTHPTMRDELHHNVRDEEISKLSALGNLGPQLDRPPAMEARSGEIKNTVPPFTAREKPNLGGLDKARIGPLTGLEKDPHSPNVGSTERDYSNYESKVTDPTGTGRVADVEPLIHRLDNLNVRNESGTKGASEQRTYTGSHDQFSPQPNPTKDQFNPVSKPDTATLGSTESNPQSLDSTKPEESMPKDTVAGKISAATAALAGSAVTAKNAVASKMGYGGGTPSQEQEAGQNAPNKPVTESVKEYAHTVAEKLAPVYGKVAGAGSAVMSKVQGSGGGGGGGTEHQAGHQVGDVAAGKASGDKGVSVTGYLVEKFRPGDEDKALSEAIVSALHKKKEGAGAETGEHNKPVMGKVTESAEVAARLGTGEESKREGEDARAAGRESTGQGVVERLKDAVGLWLGKSAGMQTAQESLGQSHVSDAGSAQIGCSGEVTRQGQKN